MLKTIRRLGSVSLLGLLVAASIGSSCGDGNDDASPSSPSSIATPSIPDGLVRPDSPVIGPTDARVTIVEFLDPECESCAAAYPDIKRLLAEYPKDVRLVVRYFPLHANSVLAAVATEAAGEQGKYAQMQALLFERQSEWGEQKTPQGDRFIDYAVELGLDIPRFKLAMANPAYAEKVTRDRTDGIALGVTGTPTFFIQGRWIRTPSPTALRGAINEALKR